MGELMSFFLWCLFWARRAAGQDGELKDLANPYGTELPFQHMVVDRKSTNRVYVGAVNRLLELLPDLSVRKTVESGP